MIGCAWLRHRYVTVWRCDFLLISHFAYCPTSRAATNFKLNSCLSPKKSTVIVKMKLVYALGIVFLVAVVCIESGYGIKCFVCNSYHQQDCGDWFDNATHSVHQCDLNQDRCRKIVQQIKLDDEWQVRYIRQCASGGEIGAYDGRVCKDRIGTSGVKMTYCHCQTEGCNSASAWNVPVVLMMGAFTGQYIWQKL